MTISIVKLLMSFKKIWKQKEIYLFLISIFALSIYLTYENTYDQNVTRLRKVNFFFATNKSTVNSIRFDNDENVKFVLKYILMWTYNHTYPFIYLQSGQKVFIQEKCEYVNCFVTNDKSFLPDLTQWDAVLFHVPEFTYLRQHEFPNKRSPHQKYIIASIESSDNYPSCSRDFYNYFNWTWTYRIDSDVIWGYVKIRDKKSGKIIGPSVNMSWEKNMKDISTEQKEELKSKKKAAAWFVSNCHTISKREDFVKKLQNSLKKYGLGIDIYGKCGTFSCERNKDECYAMLKFDYFFYLAFENSFSEDYVTEKFIRGMIHWTVPIVWGGADYSRFAPPGSYINAREINDSDEVARQMHFLMNNISEYASYFKWRNYYSYEKDYETQDTNTFCALCKALNDPTLMTTRKSYSDFNSWWNSNITKPCD